MDMLEALLATERAAKQQATASQSEQLRACVEAVGRPSAQIDRQATDGAARCAELTAAARQVSVAVAGLLGRPREGDGLACHQVRVFAATLERYRADFRLHMIAIPLFIGFAFFFRLMTDFVIRFLDGPASVSAPTVTTFPSWPLSAATRETVMPE